MVRAKRNSVSDNRFFYEELKKLSDVVQQLTTDLDTEKHKNEKLTQLIDIMDNQTGRKGE